MLGKVLEEEGIETTAPSSVKCDIRELDHVRRWLERSEADLVVNCAAVSSVDEAERNPDHAFLVNAVGAQNVALAAAEAEVPLVHVSTDYVFDGSRRTPYQEQHPTGLPPNHYGRSKLLGERLVREAWRAHYIVRVAALFGPGRRSFVTWVLEEADPRRPLPIVDDRFTSPTCTEEASRQILALARTSYFGTYHATCHGVTSWYLMARTALELAGKDPAGVVPVADVDLPAVARRATFTALDNHLLRLRGLDLMSPWEEALGRFVKRYLATGEDS